MKYLLVFLTLFGSVALYAQKSKVKVWDDKPTFSKILPQNEKENVVGILLDEKFNYYYSEEGELLAIHIIHKKFRLNNDESINQFNKISVSLRDVVELMDLKARVIKPNGKVVEFDEKNIKEVKDEESGSSYKIFAIDGIEKGDDMEYYIVRKLHGDNFGRTFFQYSYPLQYASFELEAPKNLLFDIKGYNGFPSATHIVMEDGRNKYQCIQENIPLIKDEKFAYITPRKERIEYRLDYNLGRSHAQMLTWDDAAQRVYEMMYLDTDNKKFDKWLQTIPVTGSTAMEKVAQIEDYLKNEFFIQEYHTPELGNLDFIIENKVTSERGIVKLYANIFKKLGIAHQLVLTSLRDNVKFDKDFQSWNYLDKYLIYLPDGDTYIDPVNRAYRIGCFNGALSATDGLFLKLVKIGDFESAIAEIKYINPTPYTENYDDFLIDISVDMDEATTRVITTRGFKGLSGGFIYRYYQMMDEDQKQSTLKNIMETKAPNPTFNKLEVRENTDVDFLKDAEFIIYSDFTTPSFLEQAGNKWLLSVGETIGPQVEMYFDDDRKALVENDHNRSYYRVINVQVPEGYKIVNPDAPDMNFVEKNGDKEIYLFKSSHTYNGNVYSILVEEYYKEIYANHDQFKGFKDVVNAAADFNKVVLVLQEE